jgi:hypothetical protein
MKKLMFYGICLAALLLTATTAKAQNSTVQFLSAEMRFGDKVVKGAPYSAEAVSEHTQTLGDGSRLSSRSTAVIHRNGEGRTYRNQEFNALGSLPGMTNDNDGWARLIVISDPVARVYYRLHPQMRVATKIPFENAPPAPVTPVPSVGAASTESLGKKMIEGVEAEGTRSVITIPIGRLGNERPLEIVSERWFSPELQIVVLSKHSDPRMGENIYRLTNIKRDEPDAALFTIPAGYRIQENHRPGVNAQRLRRPLD